MATSFSMSGSLQFSPRLTEGNAGLSANVGRTVQLANGTGSGQANGYHNTTLSIAAGASTTIDLRSLSVSLLGATGTLALAAVKALVVLNLDEQTGITVAPGTTDGWAHIGTTPLGAASSLVVTSPVGGIATAADSKTIKFTNTDAVHSLTGNTTSGSAAVTGLSSTASLEVGMLVAGTGIPANATVATITSGTAVTLSANATATGTAVALTFQRPAASVEVHVAGVKV